MYPVTNTTNRQVSYNENGLPLNEKGQRICGVTKTRNRGRCFSTAIRENGRCRKHGGNARRGMSHQHYKDGRHSKYLAVGGLAEKYRAGLRNTELLALRDDIVLLDARIFEILEEGQLGASTQLWKDLKSEHEKVVLSRDRGDNKLFAESMTRLSDLIQSGVSQAESWSDVLAVLEQKRKLIESEQKRMVQERQMLAIDQVVGLINAISEELRQQVLLHVSEPNAQIIILREVSHAIGRYMGPLPSPASSRLSRPASVDEQPEDGEIG